MLEVFDFHEAVQHIASGCHEVLYIFDVHAFLQLCNTLTRPPINFTTLSIYTLPLLCEPRCVVVLLMIYFIMRYSNDVLFSTASIVTDTLCLCFFALHQFLYKSQHANSGRPRHYVKVSFHLLVLLVVVDVWLLQRRH